MVQISGKFEQVSTSSDFEDFLNATGAPEELVKSILTTKPIVTIEEAAGNKFTILTQIGDKKTPVSFKLGEVYDDTRVDGSVAKSVTTRDGNILTTKTTLPDGREESEAYYEFTADGFSLKLFDKKSDKMATLVFKRV